MRKTITKQTAMIFLILISNIIFPFHVLSIDNAEYSLRKTSNLFQESSCEVLRIESDITNGFSSYTFSTSDVIHGVNDSGSSVNLPNRNAS